MLAVEAAFPYPGSTAYERGTAEPRRIIQRNANGTCTVAVLPRRFMSREEQLVWINRGASRTVTVAAEDLCATPEEACPPCRKTAGTPLARAKGALRARGWTVTGRKRCGYIVQQRGDRRKMNVAQLLAFAGLAG